MAHPAFNAIVIGASLVVQERELPNNLHLHLVPQEQFNNCPTQADLKKFKTQHKTYIPKATKKSRPRSKNKRPHR